MSVCGSMCVIALLMAKTFKVFAIYFSVYLVGKVKNGLNHLFLPNLLVLVLLTYFAIVIIINKAFKLFKLVLVVYCTSCGHW